MSARAAILEQRIKAADEALRARLYVSGWELSRILAHIRVNPKNYIIKLHKENEVPVGVAVRNVESGCINIFVRKNKRRMGIGKKLLKQLKPNPKSYGTFGVDGSSEFWKSCGVVEK